MIDFQEAMRGFLAAKLKAANGSAEQYELDGLNAEFIKMLYDGSEPDEETTA